LQARPLPHPQWRNLTQFRVDADKMLDWTRPHFTERGINQEGMIDFALSYFTGVS
jgi:hypothetical protein